MSQFYRLTPVLWFIRTEIKAFEVDAVHFLDETGFARTQYIKKDFKTNMKATGRTWFLQKDLVHNGNFDDSNYSLSRVSLNV